MAATILITRPEDAALAFADQVRARLGCGVPIVISPLMEIVYLSEIPLLDGIRTVVFTSVHGVRAFAGATGQRDFICYTVGDTTAEAARAAGFDPIPGGGTAEALTERLVSDHPAGTCLYVHGDHVAFDMKTALESAGIETKEVVLYRQEERHLTEQALAVLEQGNPVILPLFSPRSAALFFAETRPIAPLFVAALSRNVAVKVDHDQVRQVEVASDPNASAMLAAIEKLCAAANQLEGRDPPQ